MTKDLQDHTADRFPALAAFSSASRLAALHTAEEHEEPSAPARQTDGERDYLATCQKLEQLMERKRRSEEETVDVSSLHQELCMIGTRIQREPNDRAHEEDYLAVLHQVKESLWRKIEAQDLRGEFQRLHFELLSLGHKLGYERPQPAAVPATAVVKEKAPRFDPGPAAADDMNLSDVERQIAELQAQIRGLHEHR